MNPKNPRFKKEGWERAAALSAAIHPGSFPQPERLRCITGMLI
jgi:hypothetical protein